MATSLLVGLGLALVSGCAGRPTTRPDAAGSAPTGDVGDKTSARFLRAAAQGNTDDAYGQLCATLRSRLSIEAFAAALAAEPLLTSGSMVSLVRTEAGPHGGVVRHGTLLAASGKVPVELSLAPDDGGWCLTGVTVDGRPTLQAAGGR